MEANARQRSSDRSLRDTDADRTKPALHRSIQRFLATHCAEPDALRKVFSGVPGRVRQFRDGDVICNAGDDAREFWLVLKGGVRIESDAGSLLVARNAGEIVGEQAYLRAVKPSDHPVRGARLRALGDTELQIIDRAYLAGLSDAERVVWAETLNRALSAKLDEATASRAALHVGNRSMDSLLGRFVSEDGLDAARASLLSGTIDPEPCDCIIWFSDLAGFSKYALELAPAESAALVHELMDIQAGAVARAGGHLDKFMGDGLMAVWRAPDDDRKRTFANGATKAAIEAVEQLCGLFAERKLPLDVRIGLHIGPVILGDFGGGGRIAFTCIGHAVNTASRYEQAPQHIDGRPLGRVRMSPQLWSSMTDHSLQERFHTVGEFADKHGVGYPVRSF